MLLYIKEKEGRLSQAAGEQGKRPRTGKSGWVMVSLSDFIRLNMDEINMNPKNGTRGKILNGT